jgi:hypothetical protein
MAELPPSQDLIPPSQDLSRAIAAMVAAINNVREARAAQALGAAAAVEPKLPNNALQDFWKTLWHVDVYKDHGNDYNAKIINDFLPNGGVYTTTQQYNGKNITTDGIKANRTLERNIEFEDLFGYLTGKNYTDLSKLPVGSIVNVELNSTLLGPGVRYDIKIFDRNGNNMGEIIQGDKVAMYIDTTSHIPEMMSTFKSQNNGSTLTYAYTREIESDPADKITYQTINKNLINKDNQSSFYYEMTAPNNPTIIPYTSFTPNDNMSYFYCKWPLFLEYNGPTDKPGTPLNKRNYKLNVKLSYNRDGKAIKIEEGMNIAGAAKNALLKLLGIETPDLLKEMVFISKHHGDVAQSLVKFRNVKMINPGEEERAKLARGEPAIINTNDYKGAFVSIDVNAIIKALTIQMPYIFMYPPSKDKIIVWKNVTNITPEDLYKYQLKYTQEKFKQYKENIKKYNAKIDQFKINLVNYNNKIKEIFNSEKYGEAGSNHINQYKDLIKEGFSLAVLSKYVPNKHLDNYNDRIEDNKYINILDNNLVGDLPLENIEIFKDLQNKINEASSFEIPEGYGDPDKFDANAKVAVEKEVALSFKRDGTKYIIKTSRTVKNVWDYIDFNFIVGQGRGTMPESIQCRSGTKLNSSWGIDIIQYIYTELKMYDEKEADNFISCLRKIVDQLDNDKKNTFNFGLSLVGIHTIGLISGGARPTRLPRLAQTYKAHRKNKSLLQIQKYINLTRKQKQKYITETRIKLLINVYKKYYLQELSEIKNHLQLMKDLTNLYNDYITTEPENNIAFNEEKGVNILNTYAQNQFGVSKNNYTTMNENTTENKDINMDVNMDSNILELNDDINYYVSYSVIKYYKYIEDQYEHFRDGFKIYYTLKTGSSPPDVSINTDNIERELVSIQKLITDLYINPWDKSREVMAAWAGGKRKTQKKHKTQKRRSKK